MIITSPLKVNDLVNWQCRENDPHACNPLLWYALVNYIRLGDAVLFQDENLTPLCAAGMVKEDENSSGVWFITAPEFDLNVRACIRSLRQMIMFFKGLQQADRVYTLIDPEWPEAIKFAKLVGFAYDRTLQNSVLGKNHDEYHFCR